MSRRLLTRPARTAFMGTLMVLVALATACNSGQVVAPGPIGSSINASRGQAAGISAPYELVASSDARSVDTFGLDAGTFTLTFAGGQITGSYEGQAGVPSSGRSYAVLDLEVTGGTGVFQGATGNLTGVGTGAFAGEGDFSLSLDGLVSTTAQPGGFSLRMKIRGSASGSCVSQLIHLSLSGTGQAGRFGDLTGALAHDVGNAGCTF
jgi:hypothetical protein